MPVSNLFLDSSILLDNIIPRRRKQHSCSCKLIEEIRTHKDRFNAWTADFNLSETLGQLKNEKEVEEGKSYSPYELLTPHQIGKMVEIIEAFTQVENIEIFKPKPILQEELFEKVKNLCIQAKDALVLASALYLKKEIGKDVILVTRDERLLIRGRKAMRTTHPINLIDSCPECLGYSTCKFRK